MFVVFLAAASFMAAAAAKGSRYHRSVKQIYDFVLYEILTHDVSFAVELLTWFTLDVFYSLMYFLIR